MEPAPVAACDRTKRPGAAARQPIVRSLRPPRLRPIVAEDHQHAFASERRSLFDPALDGRPSTSTPGTGFDATFLGNRGDFMAPRETKAKRKRQRGGY